jgi:hypothetical protein
MNVAHKVDHKLERVYNFVIFYIAQALGIGNYRARQL